MRKHTILQAQVQKTLEGMCQEKSHSPGPPTSPSALDGRCEEGLRDVWTVVFSVVPPQGTFQPPRLL